MSEYIELNSGKEIRQWEETNPPNTVEEKTILGNMTFTSHELVPKPGPKYFYGVQHFFYTTDGDPLVCLQRVFEASDAEEALQQYLIEPAERAFGKGDQYISFKVYLTPWAYEEQEIRVLKLAEGTDHFI